MADAVTPLIHWRKGREVRHEHTREVVQRDIPEGAVNAMVRMADKLDQAKALLPNPCGTRSSGLPRARAPS